VSLPGLAFKAANLTTGLPSAVMDSQMLAYIDSNFKLTPTVARQLTSGSRPPTAELLRDCLWLDNLPMKAIEMHGEAYMDI
jgi:hypothetical protein